VDEVVGTELGMLPGIGRAGGFVGVIFGRGDGMGEPSVATGGGSPIVFEINPSLGFAFGRAGCERDWGKGGEAIEEGDCAKGELRGSADSEETSCKEPLDGGSPGISDRSATRGVDVDDAGNDGIDGGRFCRDGFDPEMGPELTLLDAAGVELGNAFGKGLGSPPGSEGAKDPRSRNGGGSIKALLVDVESDV
jgi:hypothetical protein